MGSFGIDKHVHVDAAFFAIVLTLLMYGIKWVFELKFPVFVFIMPTFLAVFIGFYLILYVAFLVMWTKK